MGYQEEALKKLKDERAAGKAVDWRAGVMAEPVAKQLEHFCRQDEEFAQAVVQGGSFSDCMKAVTKGIGNSISDLEAYCRAVQFYFPGAEVRMQLTVDLVGKAGEEEAPAAPEKKMGLRLDLADFL